MNTGHCTPVPKAGNQTTMSELTRSIYPKKCLIGECNGKSSTPQNDVGITCTVLNFLVFIVKVSLYCIKRL